MNKNKTKTHKIELISSGIRIKRNQKRMEILRMLDIEFQKQHDICYRFTPKNGIAVGGAWIEYFLKMEAIRGMQGELRRKQTLSKSEETGKILANVAAKLWNTRREYQVRIWEDTCDSYVEVLIRRCIKILKTKKVTY